MYDIIIKNGTVVDGSGKASFLADIAVRDDVIVKIGELQDEKGEIEIDASGKIVCPGFVDVNNHSDTYWQIFSNPDLESLIYQGITTIVGGTCGSSLSPLATPKTIESIQKWVDLKKINFDWLSTREFFESLNKKNFALNFATLIGHETLRRGILENETRNLNPKELRFIEKMFKDSMQEGALGLSTGLVYTHARLATSEELIDLADIVRKYDGVYATHIRDEGNDLIESVEEAINIGQKTKVKMHISHLKAVGEDNWSKMDRVLAILTKASQTGLNISFDVYPYTNTGSVLYTLLPSWVSEGGKKMLLHRLKDLIIRSKVAYEMKQSGFDYDKVEIASCPLDKTLNCKKITEIAASQNKTVENAIIDLLVASEGRVITSMEVLSRENVKKAILHPLSMIATNGVGYGMDHAKTGEKVHSRSFGTFTKVLNDYVFKDNFMTLEEMIRKMTSYPAETFGLGKRGKITKGYFADILVFDKDKIASPSNRENPYQYSSGMEHILVNGKIIFKDGKYQGVRNGRIIKKN